MTIRTLVVDDEQLPRERVVKLVEANPHLELVGEADDGRSALDAIAKLQPDLVFLDIQLPELDGFQVISALDDDVLPAVVFVTAFDEYAIRAFEVDAIDYVLKPVSAERFNAAVERVRSRMEGRPRPSASALRDVAAWATAQRAAPTTRFVARRGNTHYFVPVEDVEWIEADGNYMRLMTPGRSHLVRETMKGMEACLDPARFTRIHRSAIVAVDRIASVQSCENGEYAITLTSGARLTSSRPYAERIRRLIR